MPEPYDPHRDPAPAPSDIKLISFGLLTCIGTFVVYGWLARLCGPGHRRWCTPSQTFDWLTRHGGWWKAALLIAIIGGLVAASARPSPGRRDEPE